MRYPFLALDLAVAGQRRSLAKRGERRPAQRGCGIHPFGGPAPQVTAEQPNLAIRCAIRVRKYGASNKGPGGNEMRWYQVLTSETQVTGERQLP